MIENGNEAESENEAWKVTWIKIPVWNDSEKHFHAGTQTYEFLVCCLQRS